MNLIDPSQEM